MLNGIRLISMDEDIASYMEQVELLEQFSANKTADPILRLGLLLDLPPIADYETAMELFSRIWLQFRDVRAIIIGAYIGLTEGGRIPSRYRVLLLKCPANADTKMKAISKYIMAKEAARCGNRTNAISLLRESIQLYANTVLPYCDLATLCPDKREMLLQCAHHNIQKCYTTSDLKQMNKRELIDPDQFIREMLGIEISEVLYDEFFSHFED